MSVWKRKLFELFPDLRQEYQADSIYTVFSELTQRCHEAHERSDAEELRKIYGYAEWCFRQRDKDLWNAAGVSFYEHLGDSHLTRQEIPYWVKPEIFEAVAGLLDMTMGEEEVEKLRRVYGRFEEKPYKKPKWPPMA